MMHRELKSLDVLLQVSEIERRLANSGKAVEAINHEPAEGACDHTERQRENSYVEKFADTGIAMKPGRRNAITSPKVRSSELSILCQSRELLTVLNTPRSIFRVGRSSLGGSATAVFRLSVVRTKKAGGRLVRQPAHSCYPIRSRANADADTGS